MICHHLLLKVALEWGLSCVICISLYLHLLETTSYDAIKLCIIGPVNEIHKYLYWLQVVGSFLDAYRMIFFYSVMVRFHAWDQAISMSQGWLCIYLSVRRQTFIFGSHLSA